MSALCLKVWNLCLDSACKFVGVWRYTFLHRFLYKLVSSMVFEICFKSTELGLQADLILIRKQELEQQQQEWWIVIAIFFLNSRTKSVTALAVWISLGYKQDVFFFPRSTGSSSQQSPLIMHWVSTEESQPYQSDPTYSQLKLSSFPTSMPNNKLELTISPTQTRVCWKEVCIFFSFLQSSPSFFDLVTDKSLKMWNELRGTSAEQSDTTSVFAHPIALFS